MEITTIILAFIIGLVPALFWLWFWLQEDVKNPEPLLLIALSFIGGMMVIPLVLPLQHLAMELYTGDKLILAWVIIEEVLKYAVALAIVLWNKAVDEPIDIIIYMIAIALGFSALENMLFILNPLMIGDTMAAITNAHLRFLGATLLHVLATGTIGVFLALAYYKSNHVKLVFGTFGLFIAILLHAVFNFLIIDSKGGFVLLVFLSVWIGIIILMVIFEKVKMLKNNHNTTSKNTKIL